MNSGKEKTSTDKSQYAFNITLAAVAGQVGCLTILIIFAALLGGLWLDSQFDTRPIFTVGFMIVSVPITLVLMFWIVKRATSRMRTNENTNPESPEKEDIESGQQETN